MKPVIIGLWQYTEEEVQLAFRVLESLESAFDADDNEEGGLEVRRAINLLKEEVGFGWNGECPIAAQG